MKTNFLNKTWLQIRKIVSLPVTILTYAIVLIAIGLDLIVKMILGIEKAHTINVRFEALSKFLELLNICIDHAKKEEVG